MYLYQFVDITVLKILYIIDYTKKVSSRKHGWQLFRNNFARILLQNKFLRGSVLWQ